MKTYSGVSGLQIFLEIKALCFFLFLDIRVIKGLKVWLSFNKDYLKKIICFSGGEYASLLGSFEFGLYNSHVVWGWEQEPGEDDIYL